MTKASVILCSTIIPTIGRASLARTVESALAQEIIPESYEIIVVNDSGAPLPPGQWQQSPRVTVVHTNRRERSVAYNVGAAVAKGKYLHIIADDDYLLPGGISALIGLAERTNRTWVIGAAKLVDDTGAFLRIEQPQIEGNFFAGFLVGEALSMCTSLIRSDAFFRVGGFNPLIVVGEDRDLGCRIALTSDIAYTEQVVACLRVTGATGSTTDFSRLRSASRMIREHAIDAPGSLERLQDSVRDNLYLRGRVFRNYLLSAILNLQAGRVFLAFSRVLCSARVAFPYFFAPRLWQGALEIRLEGYRDLHRKTTEW